MSWTIQVLNKQLTTILILSCKKSLISFCTKTQTLEYFLLSVFAEWFITTESTKIMSVRTFCTFFYFGGKPMLFKSAQKVFIQFHYSLEVIFKKVTNKWKNLLKCSAFSIKFCWSSFKRTKLSTNNLSFTILKSINLSKKLYQLLLLS